MRKRKNIVEEFLMETEKNATIPVHKPDIKENLFFPSAGLLIAVAAHLSNNLLAFIIKRGRITIHTCGIHFGRDIPSGVAPLPTNLRNTSPITIDDKSIRTKSLCGG